MNRIIIQLGTNIGDKTYNLSQARMAIQSFSHIIQSSAVYQTEAWGFTSQDDYYNQLLSITTELNPYALLNACQSIENSMGRSREIHWGPRIIDIDIIIYSNKIIFSPDLIIPHQQMHNRRFILKPLQEFESWIHPIFHKTSEQLLTECTDKSQVIRI